MSVLIHIGYPKTGTSWFQENFYPHIPNWKYVDRKFIQETILKLNAYDFSPQKILNEFRQTYNGNMILCEEEIMVDRRSRGIVVKENAYRLKSIFPDAEIVLFVRNQVNLMASRYSEYIKLGGNYGIKRFLFHRTQRADQFSDDFVNFEYDKVIGLYKQLFGDHKVHAFLFEDFLYDFEKFISSYKILFRFDFPEKKIDPRKKNLRYRKGLIPLRKFVNVFTREKYPFKYYLFHIPYMYEAGYVLFEKLNRYSIFGPYPDSSRILGARNEKIIREYYKESNQRLTKFVDKKKLLLYKYPI